MQEYTDDKYYDCIVVGGGASGLAAISAMADLGVTKTILLEKSNEIGGPLLTNTEPIVLSGKSFSGKELLAQFLRLIEIYEIKTAPHTALTSIQMNKNSGMKDAYFTISVQNSEKEPEEFYYCNYIILAISDDAITALRADSNSLSDPRVKIIPKENPVSGALEFGGKTGREMGELLLRENKK